MRSSSHFLKILLVCFLILSGGSLSGCAGLGAPGGAGIGNLLSPVNQESDQKNTGANDNGSGNVGDPTGGTDTTVAGNGSPGQPTQPGAGKPHPPGDPESTPPLPVPGGTVATTNSPTQPAQTGIGRCQDFNSSGSVSVQGKVRPPSLQDAECVEFSSAPVATIWIQSSTGASWIEKQDLPLISINACGLFDTTITFYCNKPVAVKIKVDYGYQGTLYEAWSDEISVPSSSISTPGDSPSENSGDTFDGGRGNHLPIYFGGGLHNPLYTP